MPKLLFALVLVSAAFPQHSFSNVDRVVAVGDVHGGFEELLTVLRDAGVIDAKNQWIAGKTHLVQTGDILDRGAESRKVMDLLMDLEKQARRAKGRVHALIGNHEAMNVYGDLRYVSPGEYEAFKSSRAEEYREAAYKESRPPDASRAKWNAEHPLGWVEHRKAFAADGKYGEWIRSLNAVVQVNDALFLHGGIGPKYATATLKELNERVRAELLDVSKVPGGVAIDPEGPLWYRGLAQRPEAELASQVDQVLKNFGVRRIVIGHTPTEGAVMPRFGGKVIVIDVGMLPFFGGVTACLILEGSKAIAVHRGKRLDLPENGDLAAYLKAASDLDPPDSRLRKFVARAGQNAGSVK